MAIGALHFKEATKYKADKALVAAQFNGLQVEARIFKDGDGSKPDFLNRNPTGVVPYLETEWGSIAGSNNAAKYVARTRSDTNLYGKTFENENAVDTWLEYCIYELEAPLMTWVYPCMGLMADSAATPGAKADVEKALAKLEAALGKTGYLLGDFLSLADIVIVCALKEGFVRVFDAPFRKPFPKVSAWFEGCCKLTEFRQVLGDIKLCTKAEAPKPFNPPKAAKKAASPKQKAASPKQKAASPKQKAAASPKQKKAAAPAAASGGGSAEVEGEIKKVGDEIRVLKDKLKAEGLSGKKINEHPDIKVAVDKLTALKQQMTAASAAPAAAKSPKQSPKKSPAAAPAAAAGDSEAQIKAVGDAIRVLKENLKGEGLSGKKVNEHAEVKSLVDKLTALKSGAPAAAPAAPAAKKSPKSSPRKSPAKPPAPAPAPAAGGDADAQIKSVGDDIRTLKDKLKADGLSGKKVNDHAEVKALVAKLQGLKTQAA